MITNEYKSIIKELEKVKAGKLEGLIVEYSDSNKNWYSTELSKTKKIKIEV